MKTKQPIRAVVPEGPRGLSPRDRREWNMHIERLFEIYEVMECESASKVVCGTNGEGSFALFFLGDFDDFGKIQEVLRDIGRS